MKIKKQYIHQAQRKQETATDLDDRFRVIYLLKEVYDIAAISSHPVWIERTKWYRDPDVWIPLKQTAIDLHGEVHGDGETLSRKDLDRIEDYQSEKIKYIIIWKAKTNGYSREGILKELDKYFKFKRLEI